MFVSLMLSRACDASGERRQKKPSECRSQVWQFSIACKPLGKRIKPPLMELHRFQSCSSGNRMGRTLHALTYTESECNRYADLAEITSQLLIVDKQLEPLSTHMRSGLFRAASWGTFHSSH